MRDNAGAHPEGGVMASIRLAESALRRESQTPDALVVPFDWHGHRRGALDQHLQLTRVVS
jgi:hypothetical protein